MLFFEGVSYSDIVLHFQSLEYSDKEFALQPHMENIDRLFAGETMEEIFKALEEDGSEWATKQLNTLKKMVKRNFSSLWLLALVA